MTPQERIARAERAQRALDEFITPILTEARDAYTSRIIELAALELDRNVRGDKMAALSTAIRVVDAIEDGLKAVIMDGSVADKDKLLAEKLERMSPAHRRIFGMVPAR
jgi:hypothetical protein